MCWIDERICDINSPLWRPHSDSTPVELCPPRYAPALQGAFSLWCRKGKAFCECALALYWQQHGEDKQNIELVPPRNVSANARASDLNFFKFLSFFRHVLVVSYLKMQQTKYLNYKNFNKPFLCNIRSLETWNLRDRDEQEWVSRRVSRLTGNQCDRRMGWSALANKINAIVSDKVNYGGTHS